MASDFQDPLCWRVARPCPLSDSSSNHKLSCQAWFRCEMAGDYVIRWRCSSFEERELNVTDTELSLCSNQSDSRDLSECPPPVVCADDPYLNKAYMKNSDLSIDVVLAIAVSIFAFLAILLIVVSSYKYWRLRKRLSQEAKTRPYLVRDFPHPVRYHNLWGTGYPHHWDQDSGKKAQSNSSRESPRSDVYFSRPQESSSHFERLLFPLDDFMNQKKENSGSEPSTPRRLFSSSGIFQADPSSVATGSFVFHQPIGGVGLGGFNGRVHDYANQKKQTNKQLDEQEKSFECYHIYKGNFRKVCTQERQHEIGQRVDYAQEYTRLQNGYPDSKRVSQISSIAIPSELDGFQKTMAEHEYMNPDTKINEDVDEKFFMKKNYQANCSSESSQKKPVGYVARSSNSHHYIINSGAHKSNNHQYKSHLPKGGYPNNITTTHTSPEVISSHNFTNKFVRVGKNVYRPLMSKSASVSSINLSSSNDLSYDSFLNEHLKELAKQGAASSSTLETGFRLKDHESSTALNIRY